MNKVSVILTLCLLLLAPSVYAIDLQSAKNQGLVGENTSGYLEAVTSASPETQELIDTVNKLRKQKYQEIAARNKTALEDVELLAAKKAIEKSKPGSYIKQDGIWRTK